MTVACRTVRQMWPYSTLCRLADAIAAASIAAAPMGRLRGGRGGSRRRRDRQRICRGASFCSLILRVSAETETRTRTQRALSAGSVLSSRPGDCGRAPLIPFVPPPGQSRPSGGVLSSPTGVDDHR